MSVFVFVLMRSPTKHTGHDSQRIKQSADVGVGIV